MAIEERVRASGVPGIRVAFWAEKSGTLNHLGGDKNDILQSTQLAQQIYDIVGLPSLNNIILCTDKEMFWGRLSDAGVTGVVAPAGSNLAALSKLLNDLGSAAGTAPSGPAASGRPDLMPQFRKLAAEYLNDFAETALMVQIKQAGVNEQNPTPEQLQKLASGLEKAALMIVGPSQAKELGEKLKKLI
jgi:hypothetical protein